MVNHKLSKININNRKQCLIINLLNNSHNNNNRINIKTKNLIINLANRRQRMHKIPINGNLWVITTNLFNKNYNSIHNVNHNINLLIIKSLNNSQYSNKLIISLLLTIIKHQFKCMLLLSNKTNQYSLCQLISKIFQYNQPLNRNEC